MAFSTVYLRSRVSKSPLFEGCLQRLLKPKRKEGRRWQVEITNFEPWAFEKWLGWDEICHVSMRTTPAIVYSMRRPTFSADAVHNPTVEDEGAWVRQGFKPSPGARSSPSPPPRPRAVYSTCPRTCMTLRSSLRDISSHPPSSSLSLSRLILLNETQNIVTSHVSRNIDAILAPRFNDCSLLTTSLERPPLDMSAHWSYIRCLRSVISILSI